MKKPISTGCIGQTATILLNDEKIGFVGKIHPNMEKQYDVKNVFAFELDLEQLLNTETVPLAYEAIPRFPSISRDIALIVDKEKSAGELEQIITEAGGKLLKEVKVFDVYQGDKVEAGKNPLLSPLRILTLKEP